MHVITQGRLNLVMPGQFLQNLGPCTSFGQLGDVSVAQGMKINVPCVNASSNAIAMQDSHGNPDILL